MEHSMLIELIANKSEHPAFLTPCQVLSEWKKVQALKGPAP
jgi:hypothetical protein